MYFNKLIGALSPTFEKRQLLAALDDIFDRLEVVLELTTMDAAVAAQLKPNYPVLDREFTGIPAYRGNVLVLLNKHIEKLVAQRTAFYKYVDGLYGPDVMKDIFDYEKTNVMSLINALTFFTSYAHTLCISLAIAAASDSKIVSVIDREDNEMLASPSNLHGFITAFKALQTPLNEVQKVLKGLRNISYNSDAPEEVRNITSASPDPLKTNLLPVIGDIVYYVGVRVNEWRGYRHEARKEEIQRLEQVLIYLERKKSDASQEELARIVKQINYHSGTINKLRAKVEMVEDKYK